MSLVLFIIRAIVELEEVLEEVMDEKSAEVLDEILRNELDTGEKDIDTFTML